MGYCTNLVTGTHYEPLPVIIQTEEKVIVLKGNLLISFTRLKILSGSNSHNNSKFLSERYRPRGILPSSVIFLYLKTQLNFQLCFYFPKHQELHIVLSSWTIFFFAGKHPKSFRAYIILPFCLPSTFYHSHHCIQHSMLQGAMCSNVYLFL